MAPTKEMLNIAIKNKPNFVCIVPEKRQEITTEGGLNLKKNKNILIKIIKKLKENKIRVSLFIKPDLRDVKFSKLLNADCIEFHTGSYCNAFNEKNKKLTKAEFYKLKLCSDYAKKLHLEVHAGHGLTFKTAKNLSKIKNISEFNIGHFIVSESLFYGLGNIVKKFKKVISN